MLLLLPGNAVLGAYAGSPLAEALRDLQAQGVPIVFSTSLVGDELMVLAEPESRKPDRILAELLEAHGLEARAGPGGRWLVVPAGAKGHRGARLGALRGEVLSEHGKPLAGVVLLVQGSDLTTTTSSNGRFHLAGVPEGRHELRIQPMWAEVSIDETVEVRAGASSEVVFTVAEIPMPTEQIVVVSSMSMLREEPTPGVALTRDQIQALPHFGDDFYRAIHVLPGVSGNDLVAAFHVRGGLAREVLVRLDGLELYDPFHLKDLSGGIFSVMDPQAITGVELMPGSFPAEFGDRSTSVVDIATYRPSRLQGQLGISFSNAWVGGSGRFDEERGDWLASVRRGYIDLVLKLANDENETDGVQADPRYWDVFGKLGRQLGERHRLGLNLLVAEEDLTFSDVDDPGEVVDIITSFTDHYYWLSHQALLGAHSLVDTVASAATIDHDRFNLVNESDERYRMEDLRTIDLLGMRQDWSIEPSPRQYLKTGFEIRSFDVLFDYRDELQRDDSIDDPRFRPPELLTSFQQRFDGLHTSLYASDRLRVGSSLTFELGVRWDRQTLIDADQLSPRLNALYDLGRGGRLRFGWGHFFQSQKPHELEVQYGETELQPAKRAEHLTLGWEIELASLGLVRLEAYRRVEKDPHHRWETLLDPFKPFPQPKLDLVLVDPDRVEARGLELYLRGRGLLDWFLHYTYSSVIDEVDGRDQPRWIDQPHALTGSLAWRPGPKWTLAGVWRYHTGWPTTAVTAEAFFPEEGERRILVVHEIGPFYGERLADYHSLDLRISRSSRLRRGLLTLFLDVQNLYDRKNPRGLEIEDRNIRHLDGRFLVTFLEKHWLGFLPSFGVSWEF